jgi:hypothetical protein
VILEIRGVNLPGRAWAGDGVARENVHVGIQLGRVPVELVAGDSAGALWAVELRTVEVDGGVDFRGPAVQGPRGERFVYLTWGDVGPGGLYAMFRRAKLMLSELEPLLAEGIPDRVVATVDLTDERGAPRCARLRPPAVQVAVSA